METTPKRFEEETLGSPLFQSMLLGCFCKFCMSLRASVFGLANYSLNYYRYYSYDYRYRNYRINCYNYYYHNYTNQLLCLLLL